jgi:hypothetical protein
MTYNIAIAILVFALILTILLLKYLLEKEKWEHTVTRAYYKEEREKRQCRDRAENVSNRIFNALKTFIKVETLPLTIRREEGIITVSRRGKVFYECFLRAEPACVVCVTTNVGGCTYEHEVDDDFITWLIEGAKSGLKTCCVDLVV